MKPSARWLTVIAGCLLALALGPAPSATAAPDTAPVAPAADPDGFAAYLAELRAVVAKGDKAKAASLCQFPLHSYEFAAVAAKAARKHAKKGEEPAPLDPDVDERTFTQHFGLFFDRGVKKNLLTHPPLRHDDDDPAEAWYSVGMKAGKTWSAWFVFRRNDQGVWKLAGTDNVSQ